MFPEEEHQGKEVEVLSHCSVPGSCIGADVVVSLLGL